MSQTSDIQLDHGVIGETTSAFSIGSFWWAINTAVTISSLIEARDARFRAWS